MHTLSSSSTPLPNLTPPLHLRQQGHGATVVCVHASGSSGAQWQALFDAWARPAAHAAGPVVGAHLVAPDLHGHGLSPTVLNAPSLLALDGQAMARLLPPEGAHLVGHSYGGAVALWVAQHHPGRVRSLALYEPAAFGLLQDTPDDACSAEVTVIGATLGLLVAQGRVAAAARVFTEYWSGADAWTALHPRQQDAVTRRMPSIVQHFESLAAAPWAPQVLARLRVPVLLMEGEHTRAPTRRIVDGLSQGWPQARRTRLPGAGHMGPVTHAPAVVSALLEHLGQAMAPVRVAAQRPTQATADSGLAAQPMAA